MISETTEVKSSPAARGRTGSEWATNRPPSAQLCGACFQNGLNGAGAGGTEHVKGTEHPLAVLPAFLLTPTDVGGREEGDRWVGKMSSGRDPGARRHAHGGPQFATYWCVNSHLPYLRLSFLICKVTKIIYIITLPDVLKNNLNVYTDVSNTS